MDLGHPLRSLAPSLDADVLEVLARSETGLGVSQIARLAARGSRQGIAPVVDRLVDHGVVLAEPASQGHLYRLNREHLLAAVVLAVASTRSILLERIGSRVAALDPPPVHASVFGSFARGEAGPDSDIDLLLLSASESDLESLEDPVASLKADVERWTGNRVQLLLLTVERCRGLRAAGEPIVDEWLADARRIEGVELASILDEAGPTSSRRRVARSSR